MKDTIDVVVIGSGIGGLCCGALCARAGREVLVLEAHSQPGGAAHGFQRNGYHFESGPSLWTGLGRWPSTNPLAQILKALDQTLEVIPYKNWDVLIPEGDLRIPLGQEGFESVIHNLRGPASVDEWRKFTEILRPIASATAAFPLLALRPGLDVMSQFLNRGRNLLPHLVAMRHLSGPFGLLVDRHLSDPFLRNWVDLLCFLISGMPMAHTNAAAMATLFGDWFEPETCLDYPVGGSAAVVDALVRGLRIHGGGLRTGARVERVHIESGRACGVQLSCGELIRADQVVSNADIWSSLSLFPKSVAGAWQRNRVATPACNSFLHLHLGFDSNGLNDLPIHTVCVENWERGISAERNVVVFSIPSVLDPSLAPDGQHVLHGYTPASEPWKLWTELSYGTEAYKVLKEERCSVFWSILESRIPDIRDRCGVVMEGTPVTHSRFLNVYQGSYGPALSASKGLFPGVSTPINGFWMCGSSTFPGIGVPPVAASGAMVAHGIIGKQAQSELLKELGI